MNTKKSITHAQEMLQLDIAAIVIQGMRRKGWTPRILAAETQMNEAKIRRVLHGTDNCTVDDLGVLFYAVEVNPHLVVGMIRR